MQLLETPKSVITVKQSVSLANIISTIYTVDTFALMSYDFSKSKESSSHACNLSWSRPVRLVPPISKTGAPIF